MTIQFKIITPERIVFDEAVDGVALPTVDGEITVLPNHIPIISLLKAGVLRIKRNLEELILAVSRGVIEVDGKSITILADSADRADELEEAKIERAREEARKLMDEKRHDEEGFTEAAAMLERELARLSAVKHFRKRAGNMPKPISSE